MFNIQEEELARYIREISLGDESALREFYDRYGKLMLTTILSFVNSRESAEEVLQDTLMVIVTHPPNKPIINARAWLFKVIHNISVKKERKDRSMQTEWLSDEEDLLLSEDVPEIIESSPNQIEALQCLDTIEQQCVIMCVFGQMKLPQVARLLGLPYKRVCNKYDYAVRKLRKYYEERRCKQ